MLKNLCGKIVLSPLTPWFCTILIILMTPLFFNQVIGGENYWDDFIVHHKLLFEHKKKAQPQNPSLYKVVLIGSSIFRQALPEEILLEEKLLSKVREKGKTKIQTWSIVNNALTLKRIKTLLPDILAWKADVVFIQAGLVAKKLPPDYMEEKDFSAKVEQIRFFLKGQILPWAPNFLQKEYLSKKPPRWEPGFVIKGGRKAPLPPDGESVTEFSPSGSNFKISSQFIQQLRKAGSKVVLVDIPNHPKFYRKGRKHLREERLKLFRLFMREFLVEKKVELWAYEQTDSKCFEDWYHLNSLAQEDFSSWLASELAQLID